MNSISRTFKNLPRGEGALVAYVMGGDPDIPTSSKVIDAVVAGGADILEVGIPFSDPIADGRSIQAADVRSLSSGTTPRGVLKLIRSVKTRHDIPVVVMTYYNILYSNGLERFLDEASGSGVDGLIVPDLPLDEVTEYVELARKRTLDTILLAAPTTNPDRMKALVNHTSGFLYLVSVLGVTGAWATVLESTLKLVRFAKRYTKGRVPLAVGFGISRPEHVRDVLKAGADAVIVGSGIVDRVGEQRGSIQEMLKSVENYVRSLKTATKTK